MIIVWNPILVAIYFDDFKEKHETIHDFHQKMCGKTFQVCPYTDIKNENRTNKNS